MVPPNVYPPDDRDAETPFPPIQYFLFSLAHDQTSCGSAGSPTHWDATKSDNRTGIQRKRGTAGVRGRQALGPPIPLAGRKWRRRTGVPVVPPSVGTVSRGSQRSWERRIGWPAGPLNLATGNTSITGGRVCGPGCRRGRLSGRPTGGGTALRPDRRGAVPPRSRPKRCTWRLPGGQVAAWTGFQPENPSGWKAL